MQIAWLCGCFRQDIAIRKRLLSLEVGGLAIQVNSSNFQFLLSQLVSILKEIQGNSFFYTENKVFLAV